MSLRWASGVPNERSRMVLFDTDTSVDNSKDERLKSAYLIQDSFSDTTCPKNLKKSILSVPSQDRGSLQKIVRIFTGFSVQLR